MQNEENYSSKIVSDVKNFAYELSNFQNQFQYVSVTTSDYLKSKYAGAFNVCFLLKRLELEKTFCKTNGISEKEFETFLNDYDHVGDIIDAHNHKSLAKKPENQTNLVSISGKDVVKIMTDACLDISRQYLYGSTMLVNVLKGNKPKGLVDSGFEKSVYYGALKDIKTVDIWALLDILVRDGAIKKTEGMYPVLSVNTNFDANKMKTSSLQEIEKIIQSNISKDKKKKRVESGEELTTKFEGLNVLVNTFGEVITDLDLVSSFRELRKQLSEEKGVSAFLICTNKVLVRLATFKPETKEEFLAIKGIGNAWYEAYGETFAKAIKQK